MNRKTIVLFTSLVVLSLLLGGCAQPAPEDVATTVPEEQEPEEQEVVTIKWIEWWEQPYTAEVLDDMLIAGFEAENPNIKVERTDVPWNSMYDNLVTNAQSDVANYDVLGMEISWMVGLDKLGGIEPLDGYIVTADKEWLDDRLDGGYVKWLGDTKMIHWYMFPYAIAYNVDLLESEGVDPPTNWDEFAEAVCALRDETEDRYGFSMSLGQANNVTWKLIALRVVQNGGRMLDENGRAVFNSPEGVEAVQYWKDMFDSGCVVPGSFSETGAQTREFFSTGKIAMINDGPFIGGLAKVVDPDIKVAYAPAFSDKTGGYFWAGSGLAIASNSQHKEEAWKFIEYLLRGDNCVELTKIRSVPYSTASAFASLEESDDPILKEIPAMLYGDEEHNEYMVPFPEMGNLQDVLMQEVQKALAGEKDIQDALDTAAAEWNETIDAVAE